ncbi:MAG: ribbon-helix-helix domain-containing protein [Actinomycetota bacterium]|nr:ribbon-helix-helix domain-containing protein [Actinomycetota bacterium]
MGKVLRVMFSLPLEVTSKIENLAKSENLSRSELLREMVAVYERFRTETEWQELFSFGEETAKRFKIKNEDELFEVLGGAV